MGSCSVIIIAKQGGSLLFATIESVLSQKNLSELVVVDNGNSPAVVARLQQHSLSEPRIKIIAGSQDINYAMACNMAAKQTSLEYLVFLKSGYLLPPNALTELTSPFEPDSKVMLSSGIVESYDGSIKTIFRSKIITPKTIFLDIIGGDSGKLKIDGKINKIIIPEQPFDVATVSSACLCIRAADYKKLGGLDDYFYPQDEEFDLPLRVKQVGGRVYCVPSVKITHLSYNYRKRVPIAQQLRETENVVRYLNKFFATHLPFGVLFLLNMLLGARLLLKIATGGIVEFFQDSKATNSNNLAAKRLLLLALGTVEIPKNQELEKKIVLVTGATSQVGLCVVRRLIASGAAVIAVSRNDAIPYHHLHLRWIKGDLSDPKFGLEGYCADMVVHCAPLWLLPPVMELLKNAEVKRVIAFSSTVIFANLLAANHFEKDFVAKLQNAEKVLAEKCAALDIRYTIFRPTQIYGVGLDSGISTIAKIVKSLGVMIVYPPAFGRRQPVHVDDLAVAVSQAINNESTYGKAYNLSGGEVLAYREVLARIFAIYDKKLRIVSSTILPFLLDVAGKISRKKYINGEIARRMNDDLVFFYDDAKQDFGFNPHKFLVGGIQDIEKF